MLILFLMPKCKEKVFMKTQTISVIYFICSLRRNLFSLQNNFQNFIRPRVPIHLKFVVNSHRWRFIQFHLSIPPCVRIFPRDNTGGKNEHRSRWENILRNELTTCGLRWSWKPSPRFRSLFKKHVDHLTYYLEFYFVLLSAEIAESSNDKFL